MGIQFFRRFSSLAEFLVFCENVFLTSGFKIHEQVGNSSSTIFICPYGYIKNSFTEESYAKYAGIMTVKGWQPLFVDLAIDTGRLKSTYRGVNVIMCFVLKEMHVMKSGKKNIFYEVVIAQESGSLVSVMPGVKVFGLRGTVPADIVVQRTCKLPVLKYRADKKRLNRLVFCFRPFQVIDNVLQWKTRALSKPAVLDINPSGNLFHFVIPPGYKRFTGQLSAEFVDEGNLLNLNLMFKLYEDEWRHCSVVRFISAEERAPDEPFDYLVKFRNGGAQKGAHMPVVFDLEKYNAFAEANATLGTWFLLEESQLKVHAHMS